jgi:serine/threonine protein kinase/Tol biopolymer transport system component/tetratricopeptide (TPR) repeat protein
MDRDASERESFLQLQCGSDTELRREVESLLSAHDDTEEFLENPYVSIRSLAQEAALGQTAYIGARIGAYQIEHEIGRGGMGAVYLATRADDEFRKQVAIKLIHVGAEDELSIRRFRKERQILASLEHPFVARLIDGGTTPDGMPYLVMEHVEGRPLHQYCVLHGLPERDRLHLFLKICSAVHYAHHRSIIHRDLKPSNILVQQDGTPKLLDFGIAKLLSSNTPEGNPEITATGLRALTPAYASPEQLQGLAATTRSDIYSLGLMLFELLTGERFGSTSLRQSLHSSTTLNLSMGLRAVVLKATKWEPEERYDSVEALAADIQRYLDDIQVSALSEQSENGQKPPPLPGSIAILPFRLDEKDSTADAYLGLGITDGLIARLSRVGRISVQPTSAVMKYSGAGDAIRAGKDLRVKYVLDGRLRTIHDRVRLSVQLISVETGTPVWATTIDEPVGDLLKLEDSITEQVAHALIPQLTGEEHEQLNKGGTASAKAYELYLRGRWHQTRALDNPQELVKALVCFMGAIAEDPDYAPAHVGVADYYISLGIWGGLPPLESYAAAKDSACKAIQIDPTLAAAHVSLAVSLWVLDGALEDAEEHFHLAITRNPDYPDAHFWFGMLNGCRNRPELAIACLERACRLSSQSPSSVTGLAGIYYNARQYDKAIQILNEAIRAGKVSPMCRELLSSCYLRTGQLTEALSEANNAVKLSDGNVSSLCALAYAEAANGRQDRSIEIASQVEKQAAKRYLSGYYRASTQLAAGDKDQCLQLLEKAVLARDWMTWWLAVGPEWDPVRDDPRFQRLISGEPPRTTEEPAKHAVQVQSRRQSPALAISIGVFTLVVLLVAIFWGRLRSPELPFKDIQIMKVTSNGTALTAAISPDGNLIAYAAKEGGAVVIRIRRGGTGQSTLLTQPLTGEVRELDFTRDGKYVSFSSFPSSQPSVRLLKLVPVNGGPMEQLPGSFPGPVSISPDGRRVAYLQTNQSAARDELWIAGADGTNKHLLTSLSYPQRFTWSAPPAWSPDGTRLACALEATDQQGFLVPLAVVDARSGSLQSIRSPRWQWVERMEWLNRDDLAVIGQEQDSSFQQIWYLPRRNGEARRVTNDLNDYSGVSLAAQGSRLVSVQVTTLSNLYVATGASISTPVQITPGSGRYFDLSWTADGRILYASDATGSADLWEMNADGSNQRQLTSASGRSYAPAASPDAKTVAFHSNRSGSWNIWTLNASGNIVQLTNDPQDSNWPQFTPDGKALVYHHTGENGMWNIWKVPVQGGKPIQITKALTTHPTISRQDGRIASWYSTNTEKPDWKLAIFPPEGGVPLRVFDIAPTVVPDSNIRWTATGDGLTFLDGRRGASNIWVQPVDGRPARALTSFDSGQIYSFDWSSDGRLAFSRGMGLSDVVVIRDRKGR